VPGTRRFCNTAGWHCGPERNQRSVLGTFALAWRKPIRRLWRRRDRPGQSSTTSTDFQLLRITERAVSAQKLEKRVGPSTAKTLSPVRGESPALSTREYPCDQSLQRILRWPSKRTPGQRCRRRHRSLERLSTSAQRTLTRFRFAIETAPAPIPLDRRYSHAKLRHRMLPLAAEESLCKRGFFFDQCDYIRNK